MNVKIFIQHNYNRILLFFILLTGLLLRLYQFNNFSLSNDELSFISRSQINDFSAFFSNGIYAETNPPGLIIFLYLWIKVLGTSVFMVRLPFLVAGILSIFFAYRIAGNWFSKTASLYVAAALSFLSFPIFYSQHITPFGPTLLFTLLTIWQWTQFLFDNKTKTKHVLLLATYMALTAYFHYFAAIFILLIYLSGFLFISKTYLKKYLFVFLIAVIIYIPCIFIIFQQLKQSVDINWISTPHSDWIFKHILYVFNNSYWIISIAGIIFLISNIMSFGEIRFTKFHFLALLWFIIPFVIAYYYSTWQRPILTHSLLLISFPFLLFFLFSFIQENRKKFNGAMLFVFSASIILSVIIEKKYFHTYHYGEFKDIASKTSEWANNYGEKNISGVININSPDYINYYFKKNKTNPFPFKIYRNEGKEDLYKLNQLVKNSQTPYFLYAWSSVENPIETKRIICDKYPFVIKNIDYNGMAGITLYSKYDSTNVIIQEKPLLYVFNGFEEKETWDKDTNLLTRDSVYEGKYAILLNSKHEYGPTYTARLSKITNHTLKKIQISLNAYSTQKYENAQIVATLNFKDEDNKIFENYFWISSKFNYFIEPNKWDKVYLSFNLPKLYSINDELKIYVWNKDKQAIYIDNIEIAFY
ncbi:MAG TPA: glycosyltransferase family 39 protein [Bacteroidales bacterium]|nr:glycosyltransferase family 39 protein [Bacteroidales bacterium]